MKGKIAIYTAIFGGRDYYREPPPGPYETFLFTDKPCQTERAKVILTPLLVPNNPHRTSRLMKVLPHVFVPGYEYTLWLDGRFVLKDTDLPGMIERYLAETPIALHRHSDRDCIYEEAECVLEYKMDDPEIVRRHMERYRALGYPVHNGLAGTGVILRRNEDDRVRQFNLMWWEEISNGSRRDQLSFDYVSWRMGLSYGVFESKGLWTPHFTLERHGPAKAAT